MPQSTNVIPSVVTVTEVFKDMAILAIFSLILSSSNSSECLLFVEALAKSAAAPSIQRTEVWISGVRFPEHALHSYLAR